MISDVIVQGTHEMLVPLVRELENIKTIIKLRHAASDLKRVEIRLVYTCRTK